MLFPARSLHHQLRHLTCRNGNGEDLSITLWSLGSQVKSLGLIWAVWCQWMATRYQCKPGRDKSGSGVNASYGGSKWKWKTNMLENAERWKNLWGRPGTIAPDSTWWGSENRVGGSGVERLSVYVLLAAAWVPAFSPISNLLKASGANL